MASVHSSLPISAADFDAYVELTRQALQSAVSSVTVSEMTEFYQIFESFREYNSTGTICNQADCQTPASELDLDGEDDPVSFSKAYIATSAPSLLVTNNAPR
jgi:hypothetical protein